MPAVNPEASLIRRPLPRVIGGVVLWALSGSLAAQEHPDRHSDIPEPEFRYSECDHQGRDDLPALEIPREKLAEGLCRASLWLDSLFGDEADPLAARRSHGRLEWINRYDKKEKLRSELRFRVRVQLPNMKNRVSAFFGREPDENFLSDRQQNFALQQNFPQLSAEQSWIAGLGYRFPDKYRVKSDLKVGVRGLKNTKLFIQNRFLANLYADDKQLLSARLVPFWTNKDETGLTGGLDYSYALSNSRLIRWQGLGTSSKVFPQLNWRSSVIFYQSLTAQRGIALEAFVFGNQNSAETVHAYGPRIIFRWPLWDGRLVIETGLTHSWEKILGRENRLEVTAGTIVLEMPFGEDG